MSPVVGVALTITLTVVLASTLVAATASYEQRLDRAGTQFDQVATVSGNPYAGETGDLLRPANNEAGATDVDYRMNFTVASGSKAVGKSLKDVKINVTTGDPDMFSGLQKDQHLQVAVIDHDSNGTTDEVLTENVTQFKPQDGGSKLKIKFDGSYTLEAEDSLVIEMDGVDNPVSPGDYDVKAKISNKNKLAGTLTIV